MDLVAGLHWLHENLGAFGGDPDRLTLFGYGTGAALANFLAVSPMVKGNTTPCKLSTPWKLVCSKVVRRIRSMLHEMRIRRFEERPLFPAAGNAYCTESREF